MRYILRNIVFESKDILRRIVRVFISSFGIVFLISFLTVFISLRSSVTDYIEKRIFGRLDINEIRVTNALSVRRIEAKDF